MRLAVQLPACLIRFLICFLLVANPECLRAAEISAGNATIRLSDSGELLAVSMPGKEDFKPVASAPFCILEAGDVKVLPDELNVTSEGLTIRFTDSSKASFELDPYPGFTLFRLKELDLHTSVTNMKFPIIPVPSDARLNPTLNASFTGEQVIGVFSGTPEVLAYNDSSKSRTADLKGCTHSFLPVADAKQGALAAEFISTCTLSTPGWSMQGTVLTNRLVRENVTGLRAWIHGDGHGQQLKFQLVDEGGGATDYYVPIDFIGWREITMTSPALNINKGTYVTGLNIYYNGVPANTTVRCLIDGVTALIVEGESTGTVELETFENSQSQWWNDGSRRLGLLWEMKHVSVGDTFAIVACAEDELWESVTRFEKAAGILTPYPNNVWNKRAPAVKESYLFLTSFSESDFDKALELARAGGFKHVLIEQHSWCESTGHYNINKRNFPDGLDALVRTVHRFKENGIQVGLHLLAASIDSKDPYLTPTPDARLYKDAHTELVSVLDAITTTIVVNQMPDGFPQEDGGYYGDGTVLQVDSELIKYTSRTATAPYTFSGCTRGHLGTGAAAHEPGTSVFHLARSYGYHMMDMDTSLLDEVTSNFAKVANACDLDMVYFDGAERLQGNHQRYNGRLVNAFLSKLDRKDIIVQASSFSHHSWHQLARSASADGHGDLKGYLEQRAPSFKSFRETGIPLDVGWYYGYDILATPDMYEYILGATIGYNASFSFQVSVAAARKHPFTMEILDLVSRYEKLRLSGRVGDHLKELLHVDERLMGKAPEDSSRDNSVRRDYRLLQTTGTDVLQRVIYGEWQGADTATSTTQWKVDVSTGPVTVGVQIQAPKEGSLVNPVLEIAGQVFRWNGAVEPGAYVVLWPGEPAKLYASDNKQISADFTPAVTLQPGTHDVRFKCGNSASGSYRVRVNLICPERHVIP